MLSSLYYEFWGAVITNRASFYLPRAAPRAMESLVGQSRIFRFEASPDGNEERNKVNEGIVAHCCCQRDWEKNVKFLPYNRSCREPLDING